MNPSEKLQKQDDTIGANAQRYRSMVGGLMYLSHTWLDIAFVTRVSSRFINSPTRQHMGVVRRILRYIFGTVDLGIVGR